MLYQSPNGILNFSWTYSDSVIIFFTESTEVSSVFAILWCRKLWRQEYLVIILAVFVTLFIGLSAFGMWFIWRRRQQALNSYKPVNAAVPEQELQPLWPLEPSLLGGHARKYIYPFAFFDSHKRMCKLVNPYFLFLKMNHSFFRLLWDTVC